MKFVVTRYQITGCWFGRRHSEKGVNSDELNLILSGFKNWVDGASQTTATRIYGTQPFAVYVKDCDSQGLDYVVSLWLSSADQNENVYAISGDDPPNGEQHIEVLHGEDGSIPGTPAFFFVDAQHNTLYTIRPEKSRVSGKPQFDAAIRYYMAHHAQVLTRSRGVDDDGTSVVTINMYDEDGELLTPKFESELQKNPTVASEMLRRSSDIRKIVRVQNIAKKPIVEKQRLINRMLEFIGASIDQDDASKSRRIKCEVDVRLTREEVEKVIQRQAECASEEKIAFKFENDSKLKWVDRCIARREVDLPVDVDGPQSLTSQRLLEAIEQKRNDIVTV